MRIRPASRIALIDPSGAILLMHYSHKAGALVGRDFWSLPGGGVEANESWETAARRELFEETGVEIAHLGNAIAVRTFEFLMPDGETVQAQEHFFRLYMERFDPSRLYLAEGERTIVDEYRWWSKADLASTSERIFPEDLTEILDAVRSE